MKKLTLIFFVCTLVIGCEKEEPPLTEEELAIKDYLEKKIKGYPISIFQVWIDASNNYLLDITKSEDLTFELEPEERELRVDVTESEGESKNTTTQWYKYSEMLDVYHFRQSNTIQGIVVTLKQSTLR